MNANRLFVPRLGKCRECDFEVVGEYPTLLCRCPVHGLTLEMVTWEEHAGRLIEELNGRLIERQESHGLQVVRIEAVWREKLAELEGRLREVAELPGRWRSWNGAPGLRVVFGECARDLEVVLGKKAAEEGWQKNGQ